VLCCEDLMRQYGDEVLLVTGPPLGRREVCWNGQGQGSAAGSYRRAAATDPSVARCREL